MTDESKEQMPGIHRRNCCRLEDQARREGGLIKLYYVAHSGGHGDGILFVSKQ
jgi:hypothetical protein